MAKEPNEESMEGFPLDAEFLEALDADQLVIAKELLSELTVGSIWISRSLKNEGSGNHNDAVVLLGLAHTIMDATLRIGQIESARAGHFGMDGDILLGAGRSTFSALVLAGIRFGQRHPEAFGGTIPATAVDDLMGVVTDLLRGGEGEDPA